MTVDQLFQLAQELAANEGAARWKSYQFALEARQQSGIEQWASIIGAAYGKTARTVRGWARAAELLAKLQHLIDGADKLFPSFWERAARYAGDMTDEEIMRQLAERLEQAHSTAETVDQFEAALWAMFSAQKQVGFVALAGKLVKIRGHLTRYAEQELPAGVAGELLTISERISRVESQLLGGEAA